MTSVALVRQTTPRLNVSKKGSSAEESASCKPHGAYKKHLNEYPAVEGERYLLGGAGNQEVRGSAELQPADSKHFAEECKAHGKAACSYQEPGDNANRSIAGNKVDEEDGCTKSAGDDPLLNDKGNQSENPRLQG